jgi:uncharacterized protein
METVAVTSGLFEFDASGSGRLLGACCPDCGRYHFPASADCPYCSGQNCETRALSERGKLCLFTTVSNRPPGYSGEVPFGFGVVELPEGLQIITRLADGAAKLDFGVAVRLVIVPLHVDEDGRQVVTYAFEPETR